MTDRRCRYSAICKIGTSGGDIVCVSDYAASLSCERYPEFEVLESKTRKAFVEA